MTSKYSLHYYCALVAFLLLVGTSAQAQVGFALGAKTGASISTFKGTTLDNIDSRTAWLGGAFLNMQLAPAFAIQPEFILTQRGADFTNNGVRRNLKVSYFEVPVLAKLRAPVGEVFFPHILLGPNFSFRTNVDYSATNTGGGTAISTNDADIRKSDLGGIVGAGFDIETPNSGLFLTIDGRYGFGFNDIDSGDGTLEIRNAGWYFSAGIGFLLKQ